MAILQAQNLGWSTPDNRVLFEHLNINLDQEKSALVGRNGVGKTTLIKILADLTAPTNGSVTRNGLVGYLPQNPAPHPDQTVADALAIGSIIEALDKIEQGSTDAADFDAVGDNWDIRERTQAELDKLGLAHLTLEQPLTDCSGGERTRLALAGLFLARCDYLLLDEPTNNLDIASKEKLKAALKSWQGGFLLISHDRDFLDFVDQVLELSEQGLKVYGGNYLEYKQQRELEDAAAQRQFEHAEKQVKAAKARAQKEREQQEKRQSSGAKRAQKRGDSIIETRAKQERSSKSSGKSNSTSQRLMEAAQTSMQQASERLRKEESIRFEMPATEVPTGKTILEMEEVTFGYQRPLFENFSLLLRGPERIALLGRNGCGKTTLVKLITAELQPQSGSIRRGTERITYLDQHASVLDPEHSILENCQRLNPDMEEHRRRSILANFGFRGDNALKLVKSLSGGEKLKAAMACILMGSNAPQLLILDEPTNHLDMASIESLEQTLQSYKGALIVISHDPAFIKALDVSRVIEL